MLDVLMMRYNMRSTYYIRYQQAMMSYPCGLTKGEVKDFDQRTGLLERIPLLGGKCQKKPLLLLMV
jgi:hypothetical protein